MSCLQCCSVTKSYLTLRDPMNCSMPSFSVPHYLPEFAQTHIHRVSNAIQPSQPQQPPSPPALNISQHQGLFQWVGSSYYVAKVLEFQLQHQSSNEIYSFSHMQTAETMAHSSWTSLISCKWPLLGNRLRGRTHSKFSMKLLSMKPFLYYNLPCVYCGLGYLHALFVSTSHLIF